MIPPYLVYTVPVRCNSRKSRACGDCITTNSCIRTAVAFGASELRNHISIDDLALLTFACCNTYHRALVSQT